MDLFVLQNIMYYLSRDQMKHFSIFAKQKFMNFDNVVTRELLYLVVVGLVLNADFARDY